MHAIRRCNQSDPSLGPWSMPAKPSTADRICQAIGDRHLLTFDYNGRARVVKPYCYGLSADGTEKLRAIQVGGSSTSGGFGFGKLWSVAQMTAVQVSKQTFVPDDPNYNP